ncbi:YjcQ family protein [Paenibacillus qinlingensis]|uniref:DUF2513 domain-containing protein n=1 Tax=Paenibacillus qinlingensis TaxID=1837343 RepID=A0ABU1P435_9BACL|nr:YjcQ family protein [Paenibacillus qinlingensis]MDR6553982.1 hypothetical protein [Paenibacillus qinlingensis]
MEHLDTKQKVLVAIYLEYQKDLPEMNKNIDASILELSDDVFLIAIRKLHNEGLITGGRFYEHPLKGVASTEYIMMTKAGIEYVESKLNVLPTLNGEGKIKEVSKKLAEWGYNELKDFTVKVIAEIVKG